MIIKLPSTEATVTPKPKRQPRGIQPNTQASKNRAVVAERREAIIKAILDGKTGREAGIIAGFSPRTAGSQVSRTVKIPKVQEALNAAIERVVMDEKTLASHHKQLIQGTKLVPATIIDPISGSETKGYVEVPDYAAKARGLHLAFKLLGLYKLKPTLT